MPKASALSSAEPVVAKTSTENVVIRSASAVIATARVEKSSRNRGSASTSR
ncbi:hypothetical protein [Streptomyces sp. NPDC087538]|uniref:hypothetical protein n=1 Tax=Streptomyces sp. NPDC087538 TaxID=3365797 RepID=UPI00380F53EB